MKEVIISGGLGNQIFIYAFYLYVRNNIDHKARAFARLHSNNHNGLEIQKWFDVDITLEKGWRAWFFHIIDFFRYKGFIQNPWCTEDKFTDNTQAIYLDGFWQDKKYIMPGFIKFKPLVLNKKNAAIEKEMIISDSISIHVRRGDYLLPQYNKIYGGVCTIEYYTRAINIVKKKCCSPRFFVFSDDIDWVRANLPLDDASYIDWNSGSNSIYDMYLMSKCKINIIANSTFSYWAAFLNVDNKMVIAPKKWFSNGVPTPNIIPDSWMRL